jgi:peptidoglycan/LPS O-acetylase OafA/YrhL
VFAGLIYYWTYDGQHLEFDRWIHSEVLAFGIFVSAFFVVHLETNSKVKLHAAVIPALLTFGLAMHWWSVPAPIRTFVGVTAFALAVNLINGAPGSITSIFSCRPLRQLGLWSFSIYLWQQPFYLLVHRNGLPKSIGIALAIAVGILSYYLIEKPVRKYLNTRWQGTPAII